MGEGFEVYHIPQQSRREKLRVTTSPNLFSNQNQPPLTNGNASDYYVIDDSNFVYTHQHQHHQQQQAVGGLSLSNKTQSLDLYGSILKGSKFLKPAQQLLDQIFQFHIHPPSLNLMELELELEDNLISTTTATVDYDATTLDTRKRSTLISLLDQVYKRYKHYYQQIQAVIASFETVSGISSAAPFANLDLKAMSNNFRCLNNAITDQLQLSVKPQISYRKEEFKDGLYGQRSINNMGFVDHQPVWRPQRGLPKRAVTVLRAWLFDHFLHPYPTDTDKQLLAKQTGLSRNQVSNWFINARVRLWKPMVEEVHTLEARQGHKISSHIHEHEQEAFPVISRDPSHPTNQDPPSKRPRNDFPSENKYNGHHIMDRNKEHINFYDNLLSIHGANNGANGNRGVSLTLGLHQNNNAITLSEPFPLNSERFVINGLDAQNRREIMRGQFLHDFGG